MKAHTDGSKTTNVKALPEKRGTQVVKPKDTVGGMLVVGLGPGIRSAA